jgi:hypothetical protein
MPLAPAHLEACGYDDARECGQCAECNPQPSHIVHVQNVAVQRATALPIRKAQSSVGQAGSVGRASRLLARGGWPKSLRVSLPSGARTQRRSATLRPSLPSPHGDRHARPGSRSIRTWSQRRSVLQPKLTILVSTGQPGAVHENAADQAQPEVPKRNTYVLCTAEKKSWLHFSRSENAACACTCFSDDLAEARQDSAHCFATPILVKEDADHFASGSCMGRTGLWVQLLRRTMEAI